MSDYNQPQVQTGTRNMHSQPNSSAQQANASPSAAARWPETAPKSGGNATVPARERVEWPRARGSCPGGDFTIGFQGI